MAGVSNYEPYSSNAEGFTQVLIDLKDTMAGKTVYAVAGFGALAFENVTQGAALYSRSSDGKVGLARAAGTLDEATVVGFAQTAKNIGEEVRVLTIGVLGYFWFRCRRSVLSCYRIRGYNSNTTIDSWTISGESR